jgi:hypothetical protein
MKIYKFKTYEVATDEIIEDGFLESFDMSEEVAEKIREIEINPNLSEMIEKLEIEADRIKNMKTKQNTYNYLLSEIQSLKELKVMAENISSQPLENIINYGNI